MQRGVWQGSEPALSNDILFLIVRDQLDCTRHFDLTAVTDFPPVSEQQGLAEKNAHSPSWRMKIEIQKGDFDVVK